MLALLAGLLACTSLLAAPLAEGQDKFLGSAYGSGQHTDFARYWNKLTPENAGKWGSVEAVRDVMDWTELDTAYAFARQHGFRFHFHVLVWGNQQPEWIRHLPPAEQRAEIEEWFAAVAQRYPELDIVEVVNEPLHDPPCSNDAEGGNYCEALGGSGDTGWDWIIESFHLARRHFPKAQLLLNDFSITNSPSDAVRYRAIVDLLQARKLVDAVGVQAHAFSTSCETPAEVHRAALDLLGETKLPLYVTELDIDGHTDADQLAHYQRVFPIFWEHPAIAGVTLWGFRPGLWRDKEGAYLIDRDGRERPALVWLRDYVAGKVRAAPEPCPAPASILDRPITGALALIENGVPLPLLLDDGASASERDAADAVRKRLLALAGNPPAADARNAIIVGSLGHSPRIDQLVREKKFDVTDIDGRREAYALHVVYQPVAGVERALVIVGSDHHGTTLGLNELLRRLGVKPPALRADEPIPPRANVWIAPGRFVGAQGDHPGIGQLSAYDAAFHALVPADARIEQIASGFTWSEGPAWIRSGGYLLFTDVPENTLYRWSERDGLTTLLKPSGYYGPELTTLREAGANGLFADPDGSVLLADSGSRLVARLDLSTLKKTTLASHYQDKRFNSPNDIVRRADGTLYFTDPPYGLKDMNDSPVKQLDFNGVFRLDTDGTVHLIDADLSFPNGIALSPDQNTLYVANSDPARPIWMAYQLDASGKVTDQRVFADAADLVSAGSKGLPDGMAVASDGHVFATGPGGVIVFSPEGKRLGRIETGTAISNCTFGDDGRTLYMSSHTFIARVRVAVSGLGY